MGRMVRTRKRENIGWALQNEDIQAKETMGLDIRKTHNADAEGPLCEDSVILAAMSLDGRKGHILKRTKAGEVRKEGVAPSLVWQRGEVGCILNDDNDAGSGPKRKLGIPKESGRPSADKAKRVQYGFSSASPRSSGRRQMRLLIISLRLCIA